MMDVPVSQSTAVPPSPGNVSLCPVCHQPVPRDAYFCPNCGKELRPKPLSTSLGTQAWIYAFSLILPMIAYLAIGYWPGFRYLRSSDPREKQVGIIATVLLVLSTIITFWYVIAWMQAYVQQSVNDIGNLGNL